MTLRKSIDDIKDLRNLSVAWLVRSTELSQRRVLELTEADILHDERSILLEDEILSSTPVYLHEYLNRRDQVFPKTPLLFPTLAGRSFLPVKYSVQFRSLLRDAGLEGVATHPKNLSDQQWEQVERTRFEKQRGRHQVILAGTLCSFLGLRPSEVAKLIKRDMDFGGLIISLRDTKSQEDQQAPMLPFMVEPLERYTSHLAENDPLFVRLSGQQWDRKDACNSLVAYGKAIGIQGQITPRRLRATLGKTLSDSGAPPALIAKLLRHKDAATSLRHYTQTEINQVRRYLINMDEQITPSTTNIKPTMDTYEMFGWIAEPGMEDE